MPVDGIAAVASFLARPVVGIAPTLRGVMPAQTIAHAEGAALLDDGMMVGEKQDAAKPAKKKVLLSEAVRMLVTVEQIRWQAATRAQSEAKDEAFFLSERNCRRLAATCSIATLLCCPFFGDKVDASFSPNRKPCLSLQFSRHEIVWSRAGRRCWSASTCLKQAQLAQG